MTTNNPDYNNTIPTVPLAGLRRPFPAYQPLSERADMETWSDGHGLASRCFGLVARVSMLWALHEAVSQTSDPEQCAQLLGAYRHKDEFKIVIAQVAELNTDITGRHKACRCP